MKIGLVCPYSIAKGGGVQSIVFSMREELTRRGHDTYIITPKPSDYERPPDDHIIFVGSAADFNSPTHTVIQVSASVSETIDNMLQEHNFDVLHFHEPWIPMLSYQMLSRATNFGVPNIATFHAKLPETMMSRTITKVITPYTKPILRYIDAFTAPSPAAAEYVCSLIDTPVALIPNGIGPEFTPPKVFHDGRKQKTILYVGRLEGRKGVKHLLYAFQLLSQRRPDVTLRIAGNGVDRDKLENLTSDLELNSKVEFLGYVSDQEKIKLLRNSDLFCAPALFGESFGIVLLEAMASGLVTVAGDNPGYEAVMSGLGAISLVNPKHSAEFARRLEVLLYEKDLRVLWRDWAAAELPQYSYKRIVDQYMEVYVQAIADKKAQQG